MKSTVLILLFIIGATYSRSVPSFVRKLSKNPTPTQCGHKKGQTRIVGGHLAEKGEWPWQTLVDKISHPALDYCGGSIISAHWILTAAHCVKDLRINDYKVTVGEYILDEIDGTEQVMDIDRFIVHSSFNPYTLDRDIALIKLKKDIIFSDSIQPVCLADSVFAVGTLCTVTGWGSRKVKNKVRYGLYEVELPLVSHQTCSQAYHGGITDSMLCAGSVKGKIDACSGDSGGPLVCQKNNAWYLVGISSAGVGCGRPNTYGVYTDVLNQMDWIKKKISEAD